jgi:hypothetical protein
MTRKLTRRITAVTDSEVDPLLTLVARGIALREGEVGRMSDDNDPDHEFEVAVADEMSSIENHLQRTPAQSLAGLLGKLRWLVNYLSETADPMPTLDEAYDWEGIGTHLDNMIVSAWADAERLIGVGGKGRAA